jgi:internalin A
MIPTEWLKYAPKPLPLNDEKKWNVFLAYRSANRGWVLNLYDILNELGFKVFLDQFELKSGDNLIEIHEEGLNNSQAGILIWSSAAKDSEWARLEYSILHNRSINDKTFSFVPLKLEPFKLPAFINSSIVLDFSNYPDGPNGGELIRLLYAITNKQLSNEALRFITELDENSKDEAAKVSAAITNNSPERLQQLFEKGDGVWRVSATLGCKAAEGLIKLKRYDEALNILEQVEKHFQRSLRPKQLKALAYARRGDRGDLELAQEILGQMYAKNQLDAESLGIYGRTWMDRYRISGKIDDLRQSRDLYVEAFEKNPDDYYAGINAASKSVLLGTENDLKRGAEYAKNVEILTGNDPVKGDYWKTATIAELFLLQKKYKEAGEMYSNSIAMARSEIGSHESTYMQARQLMEKLNPTNAEREIIETVFVNVSNQKIKRRFKIFISHSHKDLYFLGELVRRLSLLEQNDIIELLLDTRLNNEDRWDEKLDKFLHEADIILFLVSADSLNSQSINIETKIAIEQFEKGFSMVIPLLIKQTNWEDSPLYKFQILSIENKPIDDYTNKDEWYDLFMEAFQNLLKEIGEEWFEKVRSELIQRKGALNLSKCNIQSIPQIVTRMSWLQSLDLSTNRIHDLKPLAILENLKTLNLSSNNIIEVDHLNNLSALLLLNLSSNRIFHDTAYIKLSNLDTLILSDNSLNALPDFAGLTSLRYLDISNNQLLNIKGISALVNLTRLDLSRNKIKKLEGIEGLIHLKDLTLESNEIESIEGLEMLTNLTALDLYKNKISFIGGLNNNKQLQELGLSNNRISTLENIKHLSELKKLYVAHNSITDIGELKKITTLKRIVLTGNKISDLFPLKEFIESDIPIKVTYSFDPNEEGIFVKDNPIQYPPIEVLVEGKDAVLRNFKQQDEALQEALEAYQSNDIKLILIGNANVGKTHIATYIKTNRKNLPTNNASTHGMVNEFVEYKMPAEVKMRILDFGGQEYYHDTHHLFFTTDTIYLLLWENDTNKFGIKNEKRFSVKAGKEEEETSAIFPIAYWLDAVNFFINRREEERKNSLKLSNVNTDDVQVQTVTDPSVILVETKRSKKGCTLLNTSSIISYKHMIHSQVSISLYRNQQGDIVSTGTEALFENLNNLMGSMFEKKWSGYYRLIVTFFENIDSHENKEILKKAEVQKLVLTFQECIDLFNSIIVSSKYKYKFDDENGLDLCRFLANRGYILYFDSNKICLQPEKLTNEIYAVLNKEYNNVGIIKSSEISIQGDLLNIMLDFKLLIPHPDGKSYIAPQLLPETTNSQINMFLEAFKPSVMRFAISGYIHKNIVQELFYSFKENLLKEDTQNYIWKNGFIVRLENELYKIIIHSSEDYRYIDIHYLNQLNISILNKIRAIISATLKGRNFEVEVSLDGMQFVSLKSIEENIQLSQFIHDGKLLRIADYKNYIDPDFRINAMKKIFISYSSKNTDFMKRFVTHLEPLRRNGLIDLWHDRMIEPGTKWNDSIRKEIELSDVVIFLLSPDFIATNYIFEVEIPQALLQFKAKKSKLFFVQLQSCSWGKTILSDYQLTTDPTSDNKELITITEPNNDIEWIRVVTELEKKFSLSN